MDRDETWEIVSRLPDDARTRRMLRTLQGSSRVLVVRRVRGEHAWVALAILIAVYEIFAPEGELLSEAVDRFLVRHPWLTRGVVAVVALHLLNLLPTRVDPVHHVAKMFRRTVDLVDK